MQFIISSIVCLSEMHELGSVGLAGISICYPVTLVLMAISLMIGMGGATRFSIALGQGKKKKQVNIWEMG